jgi:hypothetical protein
VHRVEGAGSLVKVVDVLGNYVNLGDRGPLGYSAMSALGSTASSWWRRFW